MHQGSVKFAGSKFSWCTWMCAQQSNAIISHELTFHMFGMHWIQRKQTSIPHHRSWSIEQLQNCQKIPPRFKSMIHDPVITSWDWTCNVEDLRGLENGGFHGKQVNRYTGNEVNAWCWAQMQDASNNAIWYNISRSLLKKQAEAIYGCDSTVRAFRASISADWSTKANRQKKLSCLRQLGLPEPDHIQNWCHYTITQLVQTEHGVTTVAIALYLPPHRIHLMDPLPACPFVWCTYLSSVDQTQSSRPAAHTNQQSIS